MMLSNGLFKLGLVLVGSLLAFGCQQQSASDGTKYDAKADAAPKQYFQIGSDGRLARPAGYRKWVYVGTPITPNDLNPPEAAFPDFHNVYIDPDSWTEYERTGKFREGTILIKELVGVGSKNAVSGSGYFMGEFIGLEATIKSSEHFPDEPGNWAYFSFGHEYPLAENAEAFPAPACNACHAAAAADDFVFTQYYPVLRAAQATDEAGPDTMITPTHAAMASAMAGATDGIMTPRAATGTSTGPVPTDLQKLFDYLTSGGYKSFASHEGSPHPSAGPHTSFGTPVQAYFSDAIAKSRAEGSASHPVGSSIVKEMYEADGETLMGWAVMVKTQADSDGGNGWFWYEVVSTTDATALAGGSAGNGLPLCTGCHSGGKDFVLSQHTN